MRFGEYETVLLQLDSPEFLEQKGRILKLCDELLGEGLYSEERLRTICQSKSHYFYIIVKEKSLMGIFYCYADRFGNVPFASDITVPFLPEDARVGVGQSIALKKEVRRQGVSEGLLNYGTQLLFEKEQAEAVLIPAWMKGDKIPAKPHLEKCSYELLQIVEKPWASCETLKCPFCGTVPCSCDGAIYMKRRGRKHG